MNSTDDDRIPKVVLGQGEVYPLDGLSSQGGSLHIVSGPSADEGGDAPLQQRDVIVRTQHKKVEDWRAAHEVYI